MKKINLKKIDVIFLDFDGVLTDNYFYQDQKGIETVKLSRSDGLAFNALKILKKPVYIISTEKNEVVKFRGKKLGVKTFNAVKNKKEKILSICKKAKFNQNNAIFIGNDINDLEAMKICGYSICPSDSHEDVLKISSFVTISKGGKGVIREIVEKILNIDMKGLI